ncbi:MAG: coenzyme F420-0:L-glutamate ligase [Nocardioides sp.]|nr:coenzyme F420-0:L-glutamate ligase [Nocardioides sp.]
MSTARLQGLSIRSPEGLPEIAEGADLAALVAQACELADGDIVVVTSKVVSKAEGRVRTGAREEALAEETVRVVARRGPTTIVRNRLGLTMAAAGIDASNVEAGSIVLLPLDPDESARRLRRRLHEITGVRVGVVVTDTAGRAWREGQTDIAIGAAGIVVAESYDGRTDSYGNPLVVTLPAVADEIASAAELAQGKLTARPVAVLSGRADLVLPLDEDGPGAATLVRAEGGDLFGWGSREAVVRALAGDDRDRTPFGAPVDVDELCSALGRVSRPPSDVHVVDVGLDGRVRLAVPAGLSQPATEAVCFAHGWRVEEWPGSDSVIVARVSPPRP